MPGIVKAQVFDPTLRYSSGKGGTYRFGLVREDQVNTPRLLKQLSVKWRGHRKMLGKVEGIELKINSNHLVRSGSDFGKAYKGDVPSQ